MESSNKTWFEFSVGNTESDIPPQYGYGSPEDATDYNDLLNSRDDGNIYRVNKVEDIVLVVQLETNDLVFDIAEALQQYIGQIEEEACLLNERYR